MDAAPWESYFAHAILSWTGCVAVKTVRLAGLDAMAEREYRKRFGVEAQAAGRPGASEIVTMFDVRKEEAEPYLVMELSKASLCKSY